jgi:hypothetical protein
MVGPNARTSELARPIDMVLEIAAGIVLAVLFLFTLPYLLVLGFVIVLWGFIILVPGAIVFFIALELTGDAAIAAICGGVAGIVAAVLALAIGDGRLGQRKN